VIRNVWRGYGLRIGKENGCRYAYTPSRRRRREGKK
jgi:hypothetical protein